MFRGQFPDRVGEIQASRWEIGNQRERADLHGVIGGDWRENIRRVNVATTTDGDRVGGMQMHDRAAVRPFVVHGHVQEILAGRFVARDVVAIISQPISV